ncbi:MAG: alpha/beta fold hydrolase [Planctomycetales bacterium]|nr:alpha/beta fold hydrolase [Planctomycetales bacterium]
MLRSLRLGILLGVALSYFAPAANAQRVELGGAEEKQIRVDGRERTYLVVAPRATRGPFPLVLVLHGGGGTAWQMERYTRFNALARRERFVVCYPEGVEKHWNCGRQIPQETTYRDNVDDVKFIRQLVDQLAKDLPIDRERVFATGISNGAFMSHRLAAEASDVLRGIAPVVGGMAESVAGHFHPVRPVSLFVIQGTADPLVPYHGGEVGPDLIRRRGKFVDTDVAVAKYLALNEIDPQSADVQTIDGDRDDGCTTEATRYAPGKQAARVQLYRVKEGGHAWPGRWQYAPENRIGKASRDFDATVEIWKFFASLGTDGR